MLHITRRPGERIRIGDDVVVVIRRVHGRQVSVGILAPPGVRIFREEIYREIVKQNRESAEIGRGTVDEILDKSAAAARPRSREEE